LINADTDTAIGSPGDGNVLDLSELPTPNLNVRAITAPDPVGSVRFRLDGDDSVRTETTTLCAFAGDSCRRRARPPA
jgi:hypothetical protein